MDRLTDRQSGNLYSLLASPVPVGGLKLKDHKKCSYKRIVCNLLMSLQFTPAAVEGNAALAVLCHLINKLLIFETPSQKILWNFTNSVVPFNFLFFIWIRITDEGPLPKTRVWSKMLFPLEFKIVHRPYKKFLIIFQLLGECRCCWIRGPLGHM